MRKNLVLALGLVLLVCGSAAAAQPGDDAVLASLLVGTPAAGCATSAPAVMTPAPVKPQPMACVDLYCEWRSGGCRNLNSTWDQTWKWKYCFTNCGYYWYNTGQTCCYTSQPGQC